jgi:hypothetical protein
MSAKNPMNSMWHKSKARPRAWWLGLVKEERKTTKQENPAAKNAAYSMVYNAVVAGNSIGLTFSKKEGDAWLRAAGSMPKYLAPVKYTVPN